MQNPFPVLMRSLIGFLSVKAKAASSNVLEIPRFVKYSPRLKRGV